MGFIKEDDSKYPANVKQIEPGDSVIGGPNGPINICLKDLTDRTGFLKKTLDESIADIGKNKANNTIQVIAGNGLTGGGNLQVNRTITLGTPSTITSTSTNTAGTNTHSHAIDAANINRAGIARLSNAINSTSEDMAATPSAVKAVMDEVGKKANQSDLTSVKDTADRAFKTSSNNAVNINEINNYIGRYGIKGPNKLSSTDDLNNIIYPGFYSLASAVNMPSPSNFPEEQRGMLQVDAGIPEGTYQLMQTYKTHIGNVWTRACSSNRWTDWVLSLTSSNISHETGGASKNKISSEYALGEVYKYAQTKANQSDLETVKNTADNALKNSSNNAVNINITNGLLKEQGYSGTKYVTLEYLFNNPKNGNYYTVDSDPNYLKLTPENRVAAYVQVINQHDNDGRYIVLNWRYASGTKKSYEIRKEDRVWTTTSKLLRDDDISHETSGSSKDKVASEYALGLVNAKVDGIKIPTASTSAAGIVKLNSATDSTSTTEAATPSAVKSAYDLANGRATKEYVDNAVKGIDLSVLVAKDSLIGVPMPYPSNTPPTGFIAMVGQTIRQSQYPKLFALYGSKLPDMRDRYIRGANGTRGGNPLTLQDDAIRNITGTFGNSLLAEIKEAGEVEDFSGVFFKSSMGSNYKGSTSGARPSWKGNFDASRVVPTANENRPYSITFNYICLAG